MQKKQTGEESEGLERSLLSLMVMCNLSVISNNLHPADHFAHSEEPKGFRACDADKRPLLLVKVLEASYCSVGVERVGTGNESSRSKKGAQVGLESSETPAHHH